MNFLVRAVLFVSGAFVALFVARDAPNFSVLQMIAAVILCATVVALVAMWPTTKHQPPAQKDNKR